MTVNNWQVHCEPAARISDSLNAFRNMRNGRASQSVNAVRVSRLDSEVESFWHRMHDCDPQFDSPYFHPEFTRAVAAVRTDVEVAVTRDSDERVVGVFPYQRSMKFHADPIGGRLNDFHGIIADRDQFFDLRSLFNSLNLRTCSFHALAVWRGEFDPYMFRAIGSHFIDLSSGSPGYEQWSRQHSTTVRRQPQKTRALCRDIGPLEFEFESNDHQLLEQLIRLKRQKYQRTNTFDILSVDWTANLLREVFNRKCPGFSGVLSVLRAGDAIVAMHFGLKTDRVVHYWFPVFDPVYARYSPGTILLLETCRAAAERRMQRVDLGYGDDQFKFKFANGQSSVLSGLVSFSPLRHSAAKARYSVRNWLRNVPNTMPFKALLRRVYQNYGSWHYR
jgi:CelD/BcsL family acetyltransferase involved in cellulose biosynthesis